MGRSPILVDVDKFLADLNHQSDQPRSEFSVDLSKAQSKMKAHLGLQAEDYACHFVQLGAILGAQLIRLTAQGDWLEWSFQGPLLDPQRLQAAARGELTMSDPDLCLSFCLQCAALSNYSERQLCSGPIQLVQRGQSDWQAQPCNSAGPTRLRLRLPWQSRARNWLLTGAKWWTKLPEFNRLWPRMLASPLRLQLPQPLPRPPAPAVLGVSGVVPLPEEPPVLTERLVRIQEPRLKGSFWLAFDGQRCQMISQGLSYDIEPWLPGTMWLYLGDQSTDLGRRNLVLGDAFHKVRSRFLQRLSERLADWSQIPDLQEAGFGDWLLRCLYALSDLQAGPLHSSLFQLPVLPTLYHSRISLRQLDTAVKSAGACYTVSVPEAQSVPSGPIIVNSDNAQLLEFLRQRYRGLQPGEPLLEVQRRRQQRLQQWQEGPSMDLSVLDGWPFSRMVHFSSWRGRVAFDPKLDHSQLDLYKEGRLLTQLRPARGVVAGFHLILDHPRIKMDDDWKHPIDNSDWRNLTQWLSLHQLEMILEATPSSPRELLRELVFRAILVDGIQLDACLHVPLFAPQGAPASTLQQLLDDAERGDLRDWVEAGIPLRGPLSTFLLFRLGGANLNRLLEEAEGYAAAMKMWRNQKPASLALADDLLLHVKAQGMDLWLGLSHRTQGLDFHLFREQKSLIRQTLQEAPGFPSGLVLVADHPEFRLAPGGHDLDRHCEGYLQLLSSYAQELPRLLEALLGSPRPEARPLRLTTLEQVDRALWPGSAPLFKQLDGSPVALAQVIRASPESPSPQILVNPAASVNLQGYEKCWLLTRKELVWLEEVIGGSYDDVTSDYHAAYRRQRFEAPEPSEPPTLEIHKDWLHVQSFQVDRLRAEAGISTEPAAPHLCEATFVRQGRPAMRCQLFLGPAGPSLGNYRLHCQVDWPDLPFVENYSQLRLLPALKALIDWLRCYAFSPGLPYLDFQLRRILLESRQCPIEQWAESGQSSLETLLNSPFLPTCHDLSWSLQDLLDQSEVVYATDEPGEEPAALQGLRLSGEHLALLRESLPSLHWRHGSEPTREERFKLRLLAQPARTPSLPADTYAVKGQSADGVWGVPARLLGESQVTLLYHGRPAGQVSPAWDVAARAELNLSELDLGSAGLPLIRGALQLSLERMQADIQQALLEQASQEDQIRLALLFRRRERFPEWAQALLDLPLLSNEISPPFSLKRWWQQHSSPWPYVQENCPLPEQLRDQYVPGLSATVVEWAERYQFSLRDCSDLAAALARAELRQAAPQRPPCDFEIEGPGFYLCSAPSMLDTQVEKTYGGLLIQQATRKDFPPFYLEVRLADLSTQSSVPQEPFTALWSWWSDLLRQPLEGLGWLVNLDRLLEESKVSPEMRDVTVPQRLRELARQRLQEFQEHELHEWALLRRGLQLISLDSTRLMVQSQGPLIRVYESEQAVTIYLNASHPLLAEGQARSRTAAILNLVSLELPWAYPVASILRQLQHESL